MALGSVVPSEPPYWRKVTSLIIDAHSSKVTTKVYTLISERQTVAGFGTPDENTLKSHPTGLRG